MKNKNTLDKQDLRQVILDSWKQFEEGFRLAEMINLPGRFDSVSVSGMGGSSLPVEVLNVYLENAVRIIPNRTYSLPPAAKKDGCLNIFASFSGNTEETLSAFQEALDKKLPSVAITHGGKLAEMAAQKNVPCILLPPVIQPRYATGYFFSTILQLLININLTDDISEEIIAEAKKLEKLVRKLETKGKNLAEKAFKKTPLIYSSEKYRGVALIWKIKINENSKTPAFFNAYPELNHNEMVGFTLPQAKFHIFALLDKAEHPQTIRRMKITANLLKKYKVSTTLIEMPGQNDFEKIFGTLILGDWLSYHLALKYRQDPTPVQMVEDLKKNLA